MKKEDLILFYHSNCKPPHIAGIAKVIRESYPDFTSWDVSSKYYDPKSTPESPRWFMVDIKPVKRIKKIELPDLKNNPVLEGMPLLMKGSRLSVQPVPEKYFNEICKISGIMDIRNL
jgi:predicted RNA-binding protein with PUA-like domain